MKLYTIHDSKAEAFITPFFAINQGVAMRMFQTAAMDENHDFHKHAGDFTLFEIAVFDEKSGFIDVKETMENLGNAITIQGASYVQGE